MHRRALFGQQQRPPRFSGVIDGAGLSDNDSFEGESSEIRDFHIFDLVSIDVSSPSPMERHTYEMGAARGYTDAPGLGDYDDDIDEYPEYGDQVSANRNGDPPRARGPETCAL